MVDPEIRDDREENCRDMKRRSLQAIAMLRTSGAWDRGAMKEMVRIREAVRTTLNVR
jgi:hypothetical protein